MISSIISNNNQCYKQKPGSKPSFKGVNGGFRTITTLKGEVLELQHHTHLFREAKKILALPDLLKERFPKGCPIIVHAGSDGSEAYSLAIAMVENLGKKANLYPIKSMEIDPLYIRNAKSGLIPLTKTEATLQGFFKDGGQRYFTELKTSPEEAYLQYRTPYFMRRFLPAIKRFIKLSPEEIDEAGKLKWRLNISNGKDNLYEVSKELRKNVSFAEGNYFEDAKNPKLFEKPCVFLLHNQLYHHMNQGQNKVPEEKLKEFFSNLHKNMKPGSLFITEGAAGATETGHYPGLIEAGFKPLSEDAKSPLFGVYHRP